jgi:alpha-tubulin suppressor-like RCC1 family protein
VAGDHRFTALSASLVDFVTCGLAANGQAWCWGPDHPNRGGLGTGSRGDAPAPVAVGDDLRFASLSVGEFHTCGVATDGAGWCWGGNWHGQLGIGSMGQEGGTMTTPLPALVLGDHAFTQIAAAVSHTCGLTPAGGVLCWGDGRPFGLARSATAPVAAADGIAFASVHAGGRHTCGLTAEGVAYCWGENDGGQLGDGSTEYRAEPTPVSGELRFSALTAGAGHTCGLATDGRAYCWGFNPYGEVGRRGSEVDPVGGAPD